MEDFRNQGGFDMLWSGRGRVGGEEDIQRAREVGFTARHVRPGHFTILIGSFTGGGFRRAFTENLFGLTKSPELQGAKV